MLGFCIEIKYRSIPQGIDDKMKTTNKIVVLLVAVLLVLAPTVITVVAQPMGMGISKEGGMQNQLLNQYS